MSSGAAAHEVAAVSGLLMAVGRILARFAVVDAADFVAMSPAVACVLGSVAVVSIVAVVSVVSVVGIVLLERLDVLHCGGELGGKVVVVGEEGGERLAVRFCSAGEAGEGVIGCIFFVKIVCDVGVVSCMLAGLLLQAEGSLRQKEMGLEIGPCFVGGWFLVPFFAFVEVESGVEYQCVGGVADLIGRERLISCIGEFHCVFDLID